jgi:hypothetical protein
LPDCIRREKSRVTRMAEFYHTTTEKKYACRVLVGKLEGKSNLEN